MSTDSESTPTEPANQAPYQGPSTEALAQEYLALPDDQLKQHLEAATIAAQTRRLI